MWDKKGDKLISVYWFAILILVAGGVSAMVYVFYSSPYDVREMEGDIVINKVADCISEGGILREGVLEDGFADNFLGECNLNLEVEDEKGWGEVMQYYVGVEIYGIGDLVNPKINFDEGNLNLLSSCEIESEEYERLAKCVEGRFYVLGKDKEQYLVNILSIVRKSEKNVK